MLDEIKTVKDPRKRPTLNELDVKQELGHGNFSRIVQVVHKETKEVFALKVVEKKQVRRKFNGF